jgi:hypothetical protein
MVVAQCYWMVALTAEPTAAKRGRQSPEADVTSGVTLLGVCLVPVGCARLGDAVRAPDWGPAAGRPVWKCLTGSGRWSSGYPRECTECRAPRRRRLTAMTPSPSFHVRLKSIVNHGHRRQWGHERLSVDAGHAACEHSAHDGRRCGRGHRRSSPPAVRLLLRRRSPADGCDGRWRSCAAWPSRPPGCVIATRPRGRPPRFCRCRGSPPRTAVD